MPSKNVALVEKFIVEFSAGSVEACEVLSDDLAWHIVQTVRGMSISKADLMKRIGTMRASFKEGGLAITVVNAIEEGDQIMLEAVGAATTILGVPYNNKYILIFKVADGMIVDVKEYNDSLLVTQVLIPAMAEATKAR